MVVDIAGPGFLVDGELAEQQDWSLLEAVGDDDFPGWKDAGLYWSLVNRVDLAGVSDVGDPPGVGPSFQFPVDAVVGLRAELSK